MKNDMPTTPMEVLALMIEQLQEAHDELDYISTDEFSRLPYDDQTEIWHEARKLVRQIPQDQKELMSRMVKIFERAYFNATDFLDRLREQVEETPDENE